MVPGFSIRDIRMLMLQLWQHCTSEEQWDLRWCSTSTHSSCLNIASLWCLIIYHKILFLNQCVGTATAYVAQNYIFHYYWYHINLETIFNIIVMTNLFFSHCLKWLHNSLLFPCWLNFLFLKLLLGDLMLILDSVVLVVFLCSLISSWPISGTYVKH